MSNSRDFSPNLSITPMSYQVSTEGMASIGGVSVDELAERYGTPLYIMDGATVRAMAAVYRNTLQQLYPQESLALYACKANMNLGICKLMQQEGMGLDVVSGGEVYTALQAGFPVEKIFFNGNNKTVEELELAIHHKIGRITVDNFYELELIHQIADRKGVKVDVLLRITPGIECHTHDYIKTGRIDSKFGFDLNYLSQAITLIKNDYQDTITLRGLHAHIGSQIFEVRPYEDLIETLLNIFYNIRSAFNLELTDLNIGGGIGVAYTPKDDPIVIANAIDVIVKKLKSYAQKLEYPLPRLIMEPGRSMVATAGTTLYTVGSTKEVPGVRKYIAVDGGMGDNIRPALYQAVYSAVVANQASKPPEETVTIAGKYCESGDILIQQISLPRIKPGDLLLVFGTGAYNYSMASNYNRVPRPAMVFVENGNSWLMIRRESYDTLIQQDLVPEPLQTVTNEAGTVRLA